MDTHTKLITDLEALAAEARAGNFHDFQSQEYAAPKMVLANRLRVMRNDVINGKYDNK